MQGTVAAASVALRCLAAVPPSYLAADGKRPASGERVHAPLDALVDFFVLRLDVGIISRSLGLAVELDRILERGADLRGQWDLGRLRLDRA